ncbi:MAG: serine/threonine-protein phosphatase [Burkholderiales bacterium]|uniref:PP2C family protein-serine/threonine phosphatase n=1 Tax=Ottowia pentelensis TaxID=511108 RepID=A0ABV6PUL8_9BURK|nr:PP2C family serine/threonine-protein phosphatase [Ottowia sp.]MBN9404366.1 serine/threonine-protein phosphatase [Burkholderiales bacterium]MBS0401281.1 serine/threonine-protein phosphatase [Pseudomonadota bacterium]MBS0412949.1 serine/threonine-protein phosphatase [Pseudomonadota bacterium]
MKFSIFQLSRIGGREKNEDRMGYSYTRDAGLFVLADGMGGHPDGEVAAQIALQSFSSQFQRHARTRLAVVPDFLSAGVLAAHHEIIRYASARALLDTPRTTVVAAVVQDGVLQWVHCGDSRLYVVREGRLLARTRDHSYVEAQAHAGSAIEALNRNVLFTCLGSIARPMYDLGGPLPLRQGDKVMLCSDGLWDSIDDEAIVASLSALPVAQAVPALVDQALAEAGARSDNVTVLALEWESAQPAVASSGFTQTELMDRDSFASTIQAVDVDPLLDELDEQAIERSIAEINDAIQRSAARR